MVIVFKNQDARAFAENKTITVFIKRTGSVSGIIIAAGHGMHAVETGHRQGANRSIGAARNHHVGIAALNHPRGFADTV